MIYRMNNVQKTKMLPLICRKKSYNFMNNICLVLFILKKWCCMIFLQENTSRTASGQGFSFRSGRDNINFWATQIFWVNIGLGQHLNSLGWVKLDNFICVYLGRGQLLQEPTQPQIQACKCTQYYSINNRLFVFQIQNKKFS